MCNRRSFIKGAAASLPLLTGLCGATTTALAKAVASSGAAAASGGGSIPDTLDLASHGALAINGILGSLDPAADYEGVFLNILDTHPAYLLHWSTMISGVMPKYIEALPQLRVMTGSDHMQETQTGFLNAIVKNMEQDGLLYDRAIESRPWNVGVYYGKKDWNEDYANMAGNGRMITGFLFMHTYTGDKVWLDRARKTAERMRELLIVDGDKAWYPNPGVGNDFSYPRVSGWTTKEAPKKGNEGFEGATLFYLLQPTRGLIRYYRATGDERYLEMCHKIVNFAIQPNFWGGKDGMTEAASAERGHFTGHFHGTLAALRAILDYSVVADDTKLKLRVRDAYEWARQRGIHRLGIFPHMQEWTEGCTIADMVGLAVALTDAGLGDYRDDVEMYARNGLIEVQATDIEQLRHVSQAGKARPKDSTFGGYFDTRFKENNRGVLPGQEMLDENLERSLGAFAHLWGARYQIPQIMACCTGNCSQALYIAWEKITRQNGDACQVNLWMNRRSPWIDVASHAPYAGRLELTNKGNRMVDVRLPAWANPRQVKVTIDGKEANVTPSGGQVSLDQLSGNEKIQIEAPIKTETGEYTLVNLHTPESSKESYRVELRGHTCLKADRLTAGAQPGDFDWYKLFQREALRGDTAPMKAQTAYVHPEKLIHYQV